MPASLYLGLKSGASLHGVDAVLAVFDPAPRLIANLWRPYTEDLRQELLALHHPAHDELNRAAGLANRLADLYAEAVLELLAQEGASPQQIRAMGCDGQTVRHRPDRGHCLQLNNPARLAERTGITVVTEFCSRDVAAGGQGAPLAAAFHAALFHRADCHGPRCHRVIVNIGGIASLTDLPAEGPVKAFDCGPGTLLMDQWVKRHWGCDYDPGGTLAAQGRVLDGLLQSLLVHPFLARNPPKSAGREDFPLDWLEHELDGREHEEDVLSTLLQLTVRGIANAIRSHCPGAREVWLGGGGAHNDELVRRLVAYLPTVQIELTDRLGVPADWLEAYALAWLARQTLAGLPGNLPEASGAKGARILGAIYPA